MRHVNGRMRPSANLALVASIETNAKELLGSVMINIPSTAAAAAMGGCRNLSSSFG